MLSASKEDSMGVLQGSGCEEPPMRYRELGTWSDGDLYGRNNKSPSANKRGHILLHKTQLVCIIKRFMQHRHQSCNAGDKHHYTVKSVLDLIMDDPQGKSVIKR